jgi:hypothetical protein
MMIDVSYKIVTTGKKALVLLDESVRSQQTPESGKLMA